MDIENLRYQVPQDDMYKSRNCEWEEGAGRLYLKIRKFQIKYSIALKSAKRFFLKGNEYPRE
jgi:hypothetical protein